MSGRVSSALLRLTLPTRSTVAVAITYATRGRPAVSPRSPSGRLPTGGGLSPVGKTVDMAQASGRLAP